MDLTFESAFSTGGMVGHLSYLLLVVSMMMRSMVKLRILVTLSALVAITYDVVWLRDPVGVFWETLLVTVNLLQLARIWIANRRIQFTPEEHSLVREKIRGLDAIEARSLLLAGDWDTAAPGAQLTEQGKTPDHLYFLTGGEVAILHEGTQIATCAKGNFLGEMSLADGGTASATAVVSRPARFWKISRTALEQIGISKPSVKHALQIAISQDLKDKIEASNQTLQRS